MTVKKDEGQGDGLVAVAGAQPTVSLVAAGGASASSVTNTCANPGTNASGECAITFTSNTASTVVGNASITLSIGGVSVLRDTDPTTVAVAGPSGSGQATKTFVDGTLVWLKVDQDAEPLGGATFSVCRTHNLDSSTNPDSFDELQAPVCDSVVDDEDGTIGNGLDRDPEAGKFKLTGLVLGRYTIEETQAPAGYKKDESIENVQLDLAHPDNSVLDDPDTELDEGHPNGIPTFVNEKLFRLIVLTCNESTGELVVSQVDVPGQAPASKDTIADVPSGIGLPAGVTEQMLCDLGGASYGGLQDETYGPTVTIPRP